MDFLVWALRLPTNVEKAARDLQDTLFRRHALASALALPVLVPLLCLRPPARLSPRTAAPTAPTAPTARLPAPASLRAVGLAEAQGCLVCPLEPRESLAGLARACRSLGPPGAAALRPAPLPCALGIFLCFLQGSGPPPVDPEQMRALTEESFPGRHLSLLRVTALGTPDPPERWWSALSWQELRRLPLRKGSPPPPASA